MSSSGRVSPSSPWRADRAPILLLLALAAVPRLEAAARLDVAGAVEVKDDELEVRVDVVNRGDQPAVPVTVEGVLLGERDSARLEDGVPPGATRAATLRFRVDVPRPGVHLVDIHLQYPMTGGTATGGSSSQRAYLLVALGASPPPAVNLKVAPASIELAGPLRVEMSSADGAARRVLVRALTPRGVNAWPEALEVDVPAAGGRVVELPLLRAGAPWRSRSGVLVVASALDGPQERTTVATGTVDVGSAPRGWVERARRPLFAVAVLLLAAALVLEWRPRRRAA